MIQETVPIPMKIPIFQVDAFTSQLFKGNPAAVCMLDEWLSDEQMLNIAKENNLAETAFCKAKGAGYAIKWFTPEIEMDLCGHATLATAHVLFQAYIPAKNEVVFQSNSGPLKVSRAGAVYRMDFPSRVPHPTPLTGLILEGIGKAPLEVYKARDYVLLYETQAEIEAIMPDQALLNTINLDPGGIIVTAPGNEVDFVSRFFTPQASIFEDPVTGSAHCSLIPFWAKRLKKDKLLAQQLSDRGGTLYCENVGDRVWISGEAVTFLKGTIYL